MKVKNVLATLYFIPSVAPCNDGDIRLTGNSNVPQEGRVEYCLNNNWGTICGTSWGAPDAQVACRQLGYPTTGQQSY